MTTLFTKIITREIPAQFVYEDEICVVIMDKFPGVTGQTLVIPRQEVDYAFDLDDTTYAHLFQVAKRVAKASDKAFGAFRTCLVVEGFEVPHVHIKLYPIPEGDMDLSASMQTKGMADDEELNELAEKIKAAL